MNKTMNNSSSELKDSQSLQHLQRGDTKSVSGVGLNDTQSLLRVDVRSQERLAPQDASLVDDLDVDIDLDLIRAKDFM